MGTNSCDQPLIFLNASGPIFACHGYYGLNTMLLAFAFMALLRIKSAAARSSKR